MMLNPLKLHPSLRIQCFQIYSTKCFSRGLATTSEASQLQYASDLRFPTSSLSCHWDTVAPEPSQLRHASIFFEKQPPAFLWSAPKFKTMDFGNSPEVCFLGRSNVGKSSILNGLLGRKIVHTSSKPGRTKMMNAFAVGGSEDNGKNRLVVLDMPGYGKGGRAEWGTQVLKYLGKRKQMKRAFLLIDAEHGIKKSDMHLLGLFKEQSIPYQILLSKVDKVLFDGKRNPSQGALDFRIAELQKTMESVLEMVQPNPEDSTCAIGEVISCSSEKWIDGKRLGVDFIRFAMLKAAGLEHRPVKKMAKVMDVIPFDQLPEFDMN
ncbi:P-loop containing nucleoside triphosphate hydrolase protein [Calycina marina]|uniref:GTP-binding protein 8 n=1 Tax=Calycina marina TaxID=1763456 RepID=A0A9P7Z8F3_9HELO|nr:P-loop containing nucleoside triphosphate hydrolase protein [Calycina marina]